MDERPLSFDKHVVNIIATRLFRISRLANDRFSKGVVAIDQVFVSTI